MLIQQGAGETVKMQFRGRGLIALGIRGAVEACGRASEMVERLDGAYIHNGDWDAVEP